MAYPKAFALRGDILWSASPQKLCSREKHYLVCEDGLVAGVFPQLPDRYAGVPVRDYGDRVIIPGLTDLHTHAPQYAFRGLGMDLELLDWLDTHTFPEEARYAELEYARRAYAMFVQDLAGGATTRACVFATQHLPATTLLMEMLEKAGLCAYVGKVNMDRNSPNFYVEETKKSLELTERWIFDTVGRFKNVFPILTPRFIPTCSDELMRGLAKIQKRAHLPMQSHLSENLSEIGWVQELCPESRFYGDAYDQFGMFGGENPTIMAHCVHSGQAERELMKERGVFIAHCPQSNENLSSGIAPARLYLEEGMNVGLGTDVAGGFSLSMLRAVGDAVQCSKLRWRLQDQSLKALTLPEAFYMGTRGGGAFFGKAGAFEEGYFFDAVVMDDKDIPCPRELRPEERLERLVYLGTNHNVVDKYINGMRIGA